MSAKTAIPGLLKLKLFWTKFYDVIISAHDVHNKVLSSGSAYVVDVVILPKFGNSSITMRDVIITSISYGFDWKNHFFEGWSWFNFNN